MNTNERVFEIRKYFGLSQTQFAKKINKTSSFISSVENGKSDISDETIKTICSIFNINKVWLESGKGAMFIKGQEISKVDKENVGLRIKQIRKKEKLTQDEFANAIGYSTIQIHSVESSKVTPSNEFLRKVATCFNVNYNWLLTGVGNIEASEAIVDEELIEWLKKNPDVVKELRIRSSLE